VHKLTLRAEPQEHAPAPRNAGADAGGASYTQKSCLIFLPPAPQTRRNVLRSAFYKLEYLILNHPLNPVFKPKGSKSRHVRRLFFAGPTVHTHGRDVMRAALKFESVRSPCCLEEGVLVPRCLCYEQGR
jgi:hypothetical protein